MVEPDRQIAGGIGTLGSEHAPRLRAAIETALADRSYSSAASRLAGEMRELPSIDELLATLTHNAPAS